VIRINLLPQEYALTRRKQEFQILCGSVGGFFVFIFLAFLLFKVQHVSTLEKKIVQAKAEEQQYQNILSQIKSIETSKQQLLAKRDVIRELNRSRLVYPVFFEDFLPLIPSDVWLNDINIVEQGQQLNVRMTSNAMSNYTLATYLTNLNQSKHFRDVQFGAISYSKVSPEKPPVLRFSLEFNYRHQGPFPLEEYF